MIMTRHVTMKYRCWIDVANKQMVYLIAEQLFGSSGGTAELNRSEAVMDNLPPPKGVDTERSRYEEDMSNLNKQLDGRVGLT